MSYSPVPLDTNFNLQFIQDITSLLYLCICFVIFAYDSHPRYIADTSLASNIFKYAPVKGQPRASAHLQSNKTHMRLSIYCRRA